MDMARRNSSTTAVRVLQAASQVQTQDVLLASTGANIVLHVPWDYFDLLTDQDKAEILQAPRRTGLDVGMNPRSVVMFLEAELPGWRERLSELVDWNDGIEPQQGNDTWVIIDERLSQMRGLFHRGRSRRADRADLGRRCRELLIAATVAVYKPAMAPEGTDPPRQGTRTRCSPRSWPQWGRWQPSQQARSAHERRRGTLASGLTHRPDADIVSTFAAAPEHDLHGPDTRAHS